MAALEAILPDYQDDECEEEFQDSQYTLVKGDATSQDGDSDDASLEEFYGPEMVTFYTGPDAVPIIIHKGLLLKTSIRFRDYIERDHTLKEVHAPCTEALILTQVREWLYTDSPEDVQTQVWTNGIYKGRQGVRLMIKCYVCANRLDVYWLEDLLMDFITIGYYQSNIQPTLDEISYIYQHSRFPAPIADYISMWLAFIVLNTDREPSNEEVLELLKKFPKLHADFLAHIRFTFTGDGVKRALFKIEELELCLFHRHDKYKECYAEGVSIKDYAWLEHDQTRPISMPPSRVPEARFADETEGAVAVNFDEVATDPRVMENFLDDNNGETSSPRYCQRPLSTVQIQSNDNPFFANVVPSRLEIKDALSERTAHAHADTTAKNQGNGDITSEDTVSARHGIAAETSGNGGTYFENTVSAYHENTNQTEDSSTTSYHDTATTSPDTTASLQDTSSLGVSPPPPTREAPQPPKAREHTPRLASISTGYHARMRVEAGLTPPPATTVPEKWGVPARKPVPASYKLATPSSSSAQASNAAPSSSSTVQTGIAVGPGKSNVAIQVEIQAARAEKDTAVAEPDPTSSLSPVAQVQNAITSGPGKRKAAAQYNIFPAVQRNASNTFTHAASCSPSLAGDTMYQSPERRYQASQMGYEQSQENLTAAQGNEIFELPGNDALLHDPIEGDFPCRVQTTAASDQGHRFGQDSFATGPSTASYSTGAHMGAASSQNLPSTPGNGIFAVGPSRNAPEPEPVTKSDAKVKSKAELKAEAKEAKAKAKAEEKAKLKAEEKAKSKSVAKSVRHAPSFPNFGGGYCPPSAAGVVFASKGTKKAVPAPKAVPRRPSVPNLSASTARKEDMPAQGIPHQASQPSFAASAQRAVIPEQGIRDQASYRNFAASAQSAVIPDQGVRYQASQTNFSASAQNAITEDHLLRPHVNSDTLQGAQASPVHYTGAVRTWISEINLPAGRGYDNNNVIALTSSARRRREGFTPAQDRPSMNEDAGPGPVVNPLYHAGPSNATGGGRSNAENARHNTVAGPSLMTYGHDPRAFTNAVLTTRSPSQPSYSVPRDGNGAPPSVSSGSGFSNNATLVGSYYYDSDDRFSRASTAVHPRGAGGEQHGGHHRRR